MGGFGEQLRRERELRGITLEEIAESSKISKRFLQALEQEDWDQLPGGIFNRGFIRAYARYVGINEEQAVAEYVAGLEQKQPEAPLPVEPQAQPGPPLNPKRSYLPLVLAVAALIVVLAGYRVWFRNKTAVIPSVKAEDATPKPATVSPLASEEKPVKAIPAPVNNQSDAAKRASVSRKNPPAAPVITPEQQPGPAGAGDTVRAAEGQSQDTPMRIVLEAKEDTWVSLVADGKTVMEGVLNAGARRSFRAGQKIVLKTGNAPGLAVSYNGQPVADLGSQKVRVMTFTPQGMEQ